MGRAEGGVLRWERDSDVLDIGMTQVGSGPSALLLPALSSISTRGEMAPLAERLASRFATTAVDWPGFGTLPRPRRPWMPADMSAWLDDVLGRLVPKPALVVAAGHAAGYLLRHAATRPTDFGRAVLVAPTWRGPLPTMLARRPDWLARLRTAVDTPALGPAIYRLNISRPVIRMMAKGHVYGDPDWLGPERFARKMEVVAAPGARFASVRFVTGALDPFEAPEPFRAAAAHLRDRLLLIWGTATPPRSRREMEAMADAAGLTPILVPGAKLGVHEEYPDAVADAIAGWLDRPSHP